MASAVIAPPRHPARAAVDPAPRTRPRTGRRSTRYLFRFLVVAYLGLLIAWPIALIVKTTFAEGFTSLRAALDDPVVTNSIWLTVKVAIITVAIDLVFGVGVSLLLVRYRFPGRRLLSALIDLPLSVSPVVVGLALVLAYGGRTGWFGPRLEDAGLQVIFATPGIVLATVFVSLPLVVREVVPMLEEVGIEQEQAAHSLGASSLQTFRRITLPTIKWALVYGVVLSLARALGEFGAVKIVSGNLVNKTQTATLVVEQKYQDFEKDTAYAASFLLAFAAVLCIVIVAVLRPKESEPR